MAAQSCQQETAQVTAGQVGKPAQGNLQSDANIHPCFTVRKTDLYKTGTPELQLQSEPRIVEKWWAVQDSNLRPTG